MQEAQGEGGQGGTLRACLPATYRYSHCSSALNCTQQVLLPLYIIFPAGRTDSPARPVSSLSPPPLAWKTRAAEEGHGRLACRGNSWGCGIRLP
jgi:hypothetical protein